MPKLRVHNLAISLDGYAAGPDQGPDNPLGDAPAGDRCVELAASQSVAHVRLAPGAGGEGSSS